MRQFRDQLLKGELHAGDSIRPDEAAKRFGMSPLPVREALRVLIAEGWLDYAPHRGYWVRMHTVADVEEVFLMCRLLEAEALHRGVPAMDKEGVARMKGFLTEFEKLPRKGHVWEKVALHRDFHFVPIEYAGLPRLEAELRRLWDHTDHYRGLHFFADGASYASMHKEHRAILAACAKRDADRVVELMDVHRDHALEVVRTAMEASEASG